MTFCVNVCVRVHVCVRFSLCALCMLRKTIGRARVKNIDKVADAREHNTEERATSNRSLMELTNLSLHP